jgi:hypothetical protein
MFISLIIIAIITLGGLSLTYLFARGETFLWRLAAGNIVGSAVFGLVCFVLANFFGLSVITVLIALLISIAPVLVFQNKDKKRELKDEWQRAKDKTQGISVKRFWRVGYYLFFLILFIAFFDRAMIVGSDGIFTGASQNLGDLPYHLGAIFSFTDGNNFPPVNPSFSGAKFTYPFIADLLTACLVKLGASVNTAMLFQNATWAFSLLVVFERFVFKLTNNRLAGKIAPLILFFSGGLGFLWFFKDYWYGVQSLWEIIWNLPRDYTISEKFRWGNSLITLFITQRSLLLGLPLTIIVLGHLWTLLRGRGREGEKKKKRESGKKEKSHAHSLSLSLAPSFAIGLLAGTLPLIHAHSLAVLFIVSAFLFFFSFSNWKRWIAFAVGVSIIAVPELLWILQGSATRTSEFIAWHFGWHPQGENLVWFWLKNTGIFIPLLVLSLVFIYFPKEREGEGERERGRDGETERGREGERERRRDGETERRRDGEKNVTPSPPHSLIPSLFLLPFLFLFIISNVAKFAPWEWDNIKVLIYWFVGSIPFVALVLAGMWEKGKIFKAVSIGCLVVLILAGTLDVWRVASGQMRNGVFDKDAVEIAEEIKKKTEPNSLILNAPTYNSAIALTGRPSLMRYIGHLSSHGIDYAPRENDLRRIYLGEASADLLLRKYGIEYVLISPRESEYMGQFSQQVNEQYFQKYPISAEVGQYKVYRVK